MDINEVEHIFHDLKLKKAYLKLCACPAYEKLSMRRVANQIKKNYSVLVRFRLQKWSQWLKPFIGQGIRKKKEWDGVFIVKYNSKHRD